MFQIKILMAILTVFAVQVITAFADEPKSKTTQLEKVVAPASTEEKVDKPSTEALIPKVKEAWRVLPKTNVGRKDEAWLGQAIRLKVENLDQFFKTLEKDGERKDISLFLNRMEIKGVRPRVIDETESELEFILLRREALPAYLNDTQQKSVWASLFGFQDKWTLEPREVNVSIGQEGGSPVKSNATLKLVRIHFNVWVALYLFVILVMIYVYYKAEKMGAFRDRGSLVNGNGKPALSLARVQMGFWFFLVVASFLFIWMVIGELPGIPASVLGLIGIASGTALGAAAIDTNKRASASLIISEKNATEKEIQGLDTQLDAHNKNQENLKRDVDALNKKLPSEPRLQSQLDSKNNELTETIKKIAELNKNKADLDKKLSELRHKSEAAQRNKGAVPAKRFLADLLNDENGMSFHRLQMAIWTLVLGIVFIQQVMNNLAMPDFDATLLALMGISSGTYLGFKFPEQQPNP